MANISKEVLELKQYISDTRRWLHMHPEPSLKEFETSKFIQAELDKENIPYRLIGDTSILAEIKGDHPGKTIFLRADIDALEMNDDKTCDYKSQNPGLCHACGHDGHTTSLLAAAKVLNQKKDQIYGKIKIAFQAAEEIGAGARLYVADGALDDVDFAFGIHVASWLDLGQIAAVKGSINASCDIFEINILGDAAHAATPHRGKDAALATSSIVVALQSLISRQKDPIDPAVISLGYIQAGTRYNVVAQKGVIKGTLRSVNKETRQELLNKIEQVASLTAQIHGCQSTFENYNAANVLENNSEIIDYTRKIARNIVGDDNVIENKPVSLGAEDFADYSQVVPAAFIQVGTRSGESTGHAHHNTHFDLDEDGLLISAQCHIDIALNWREFFE